MKIWLKLALNTFGFVFLFITLAVPLSTNAGVFSFISEMISGSEVEAGSLRQPSVRTMPLLQAPINSNLLAGTGGGDITIVDGSALMPESGVAGTLADIQNEQPTQISLYVVRQGDSLSQIAKMFGVSVNTIAWANDIQGGKIKEGDKLVILPISGVKHAVVKGDTLRSIALKFKGDVLEIMKYNDIENDQDLVVGGTVVIPDGEIKTINTSSAKPTSAIRGSGGPSYDGYYLRPINVGRKSQGLHGNNGVDFAAPVGTPIYGSADGVVIIAKSGGWNGGYGNYVVIAHPNNTQTLYSHMQVLVVKQGDAVRQGDPIGTIGLTGKTTGSHVHFEVRGARNPFQ